MTGGIITVGHSNGEVAAFVDLLSKARIEVVVDIRSHPGSTFAPQFDEVPIRAELAARGIKYVPMGRELGGRPTGSGMYDKDGHVQYDRIAATEQFKLGIKRLLAGSRVHRVAVMCSEEDPMNCHRRLLVGRVLLDRGIQVDHLRATGAIESEKDVREAERVRYPERYQETLFGSEESTWRSIRSVSAGIRHPNSSES